MVVMGIEEMGEADQIYNQPGTPYTQKLIDGFLREIEDIKTPRKWGIKVG